jgi:purine-nucleoside phosphorylase
MPTPHINAKAGDFAETCLLPGDPLRAKFIADTFLTNVVQVNSVRNMLGFTGEYKGKKVSVMGSGMGVPSISIYAKELITEYGVKNLIRIGTAGGLKNVKLRDVVIASGASTDSGVNRQRIGGFDFAAIASFNLLHKAYIKAQEHKIDVKVGNLWTADLFYVPNASIFDTIEKMGILAVEMEAAGLYGVAAEYGANALAICSISDHIRNHESLSSDERLLSFTDMMKIALETAI